MRARRPRMRDMVRGGTLAEGKRQNNWREIKSAHASIMSRQRKYFPVRLFKASVNSQSICKSRCIKLGFLTDPAICRAKRPIGSNEFSAKPYPRPGPLTQVKAPQIGRAHV